MLFPGFAATEEESQAIAAEWLEADDARKGKLVDQVLAAEPPLRRVALLADLMARLERYEDRDDLAAMIAGRWLGTDMVDGLLAGKV
jgi:hypothetical protein